jgi:DNA-binding NarL/FixJ family response regulator
MWAEIDELEKRERELIEELTAVRAKMKELIAKHLIEAAKLTPAEQEVMPLLQQRFMNINIAARLGMKERTVKYHVSNILRKTGVPNRHCF